MKNRFLFPLLAISATLAAQTSNIGINTPNPQALLHVDGAGDNAAGTLGSISNDITVNSSGNLGIGTLSQPYKLTIAGSSQIVLATDNRATFGAKNAAGIYEPYLFPRWSDDKMYLNYGSAGFVIRNNNDVNTMVMSPDNKVGIGTAAPTAKLDIVATSTPGFRLADGSQGVDKLLTSDANGLATWKIVETTKPTVTGSMTSGGVDILTDSGNSNYYYTGTSVTIPAKSKYVVNVSFIMTLGNGQIESITPANSSVWLRSSFSESSTTFAVSPDLSGKTLISGLLPGSSYYAMLNGSVIINNTSSAAKTYYYWAGNVASVNMNGKKLVNFGGNNWAEGGLYALPVN